MNNKKKKGSIIIQVGLLIVLCVILTGLITNTILFTGAIQDEQHKTEEQADRIAQEVTLAVQEYPAYKWLLNYWCENSDSLDIEYDVDYQEGTKTEEKCRTLKEHAPDLLLEYAQVSDLEALPPEDQKLYAEIIYSWLLTHVNQIKRVYRADFLFCVRTEEPCDSQFFVFSAAEPEAVRGTEYEQVYPLGVSVGVSRSQQNAMRNAMKNSSHFASAGKYVDYYALLEEDGEHAYMIGLTYDLSGIIEHIRSNTLTQVLTTMGFQILLSILILIGIFFLVLKPLKKIQHNIRLYKDTKDSVSTVAALEKIKMHNEIGVLSSDVKDLVLEIDDYLEEIKKITVEQEKLAAEMSLAERIQKSMLPSTFPAFPDRHEFDIYASMDPARLVGGDFYDFFLVDNDHLCLVIADVSGKGIPGALFMMMSKIIIKSTAMFGIPVSEILSRSNEALCENNSADMFVTAWVGILEISSGRLTSANAGHECPAIKQGKEGFRLLHEKHGLMLGSMEGMTYTEYEIRLEPGDSIFLYTDGVPEATDTENSMFGLERMLDALNKDPSANPEQLLKNVRGSVDSFVKDAEQFDDLTMLCLKYIGK